MRYVPDFVSETLWDFYESTNVFRAGRSGSDGLAHGVAQVWEHHSEVTVPYQWLQKAQLLFLLNLLAYIIRMPCRSIFQKFRWFVHHAQRPNIIIPGGVEESSMVNSQALLEVKILVQMRAYQELNYVIG